MDRTDLTCASARVPQIPNSRPRRLPFFRLTDDFRSDGIARPSDLEFSQHGEIARGVCLGQLVPEFVDRGRRHGREPRITRCEYLPANLRE